MKCHEVTWNDVQPGHERHRTSTLTQDALALSIMINVLLIVLLITALVINDRMMDVMLGR